MDRLLTRRDVEALVRLSKSSIYAMIANGTFPKPIRVGRRAVRFSTLEIEGWLTKRKG